MVITGTMQLCGLVLKLVMVQLLVPGRAIKHLLRIDLVSEDLCHFLKCLACSP